MCGDLIIWLFGAAWSLQFFLGEEKYSAANHCVANFRWYCYFEKLRWWEREKHRTVKKVFDMSIVFFFLFIYFQDKCSNKQLISMT